MVRRIEDPRQSDLGLIEVPRTFAPPAGYVPCDELPELDGLVALDLETKDPGIARGTGPSWPLLGEGFVCGIAICWRRSKFYIPLNHAAGNIGSEVKCWLWLKEQAAKPSVTFVMANAAYDTGWLRRYNVELANPPIDVQVMAFLLDEHRASYSLSNLSRDFLHRDKGTQGLVDMAKTLRITKPMSNMDKLPAWIVEPYALDDVDLTYCLYYHFIPQITEQELGTAFKLESDCTMVAVDMRMQGVRIDTLKLEQLGNRFALQRDRALDSIYVATGVRIAPFDNGEAAEALRAENSGVQLGITEKGNESIDRFVLQGIGSPVAKAVLDARKYEKARGTFVESLGNYIYRGRIHAEFHSTRNSTNNDGEYFGDDSIYGAGSGRWACVAPWTVVETGDGAKRIDQIVIGDRVWTHCDRWRPVTATWRKGREQMLNVYLSNGNILTCTRKHRLLLYSGKWITAGELCERFSEVGEDRQEREGCSAALPQPRHADDGAHCQDVGHDVPQRAARHQDFNDDRGTESLGDAALLRLEARHEEPHARKDGCGTSQLEGRVVGSQRLHDGSQEDREWSRICPSSEIGRFIRHEGIASQAGRTPHRRQWGEQRLGQSGAGNSRRTSAHPRLAAPRDSYVSIEAIEIGGSYEVFDITVEEDESYLAEGCISHNSSNPNLQNIPARDPEIGSAVRSCFVPEDGERWLKLDYASQEPRLTLHFAHLARQEGAWEMVRRFNDEPMTDLHGECAALMNVSRSHAKTINLAIAYGQQGAAFCRSLGLPTKMIVERGKDIEVAGEEGQALLDKHFAAVPFIRGVFDLAKRTASRRGYVKTLSGRRIRFEKNPSGWYKRTHKALNGVVQGSAADQMKMACVALRAEGLLPSLIVHDEADSSIPQGYAGEVIVERMVEIMESVVQLSVPFVVDAKTGDSWGDL